MLAFSTVTIFLPSQGSAQDWARQVAEKAVAVDNVMEQIGFVRSHDRDIDSLTNGQDRDVTLELDGLREYRIAAVCDNDCGDLDLSVYNVEGLVAEDAKTDSIPLLVFTPTRTERFRINVKMYQCTRNPCYYSLTVYQRR